jgi:dTDP-4-dehydrorhamnose 3,5-epimerase
MIFERLALPGAYLVRMEPHVDERGHFARAFCRKEFADHGLPETIAQCNVSFNPHRGTLRGMHYAAAPRREAKLVRCTRGAIHDVIVDLRPGSPTRGKWVAVELTERNLAMIYVPEGFAHGFLTLREDTEVFYQMSQPYDPAAARGARWNDPCFGIEWPEEPRVISERDRTYPDFDPAAFDG